jgi:predicted MFS family arabinose efflux permease
VPHRSLLAALVYAVPLLPAVATIVFVGSFVAQAAGDPGGAYFLRWVGWVTLMVLVLDFFALALMLGLRALRDDERSRDEERSRE